MCIQLPISIAASYPVLSISKTRAIDINPDQPKPNYHPYVVEAIKLMYAKSPDELTAEEWEKFVEYYNWKKAKGEPIEEDIVYKPRSP